MPSPPKKLSALARNLFLILGGVLLLLLLRGVGWEQIVREMRLVGWGLIPYLGIHALKEALTTSAWKAALPEYRQGSWWKLYLIIWVGATVNKIYHTGFLGGDITRVVLVRKDVSTSQGVASVIIVKLAEAVAQIIFILSGIFLLFEVLDLPRVLETALVASFLLLTFSVMIFWLVQRRGFLDLSLFLLRLLPLPEEASGKLHKKAQQVDEAVRAYHRERPGALWKAVGLYLARLTLNLAQFQLILFLLGVPGGWKRCFVISVFTILLNTLFFFIPGRLGIQEGGKVVIARALGMTTSQGLTLGIVSRLTQVSWSLMGFVVLLFWPRIFRGEESHAGGEVQSESDLESVARES
jgi:uncharacterized membrane protein YbhN (UPF0104 family)